MLMYGRWPSILMMAAVACGHPPSTGPDLGAQSMDMHASGEPDLAGADLATMVVPGNDGGLCNGVDCLGGACVAGRCQPVAIVTGMSPNRIALDAANVYWADAVARTVNQCKKSSCAATQITLLGPTAQMPGYIAVDSANVYVSIGNDVQVCAIGGCNNTPTVLATGQSATHGVAVDSSNVYWADSTSGNIESCAVGGCAMSPTTLAPGENSPSYIAIDDANVYWTSPVVTTGVVMKCAKAGCNGSPTTLAMGRNFPDNIGTIGGYVVWIDATAGLVEKCAAGGCAMNPTTLYSNPSMTAGGLATDATGVYFDDAKGGEILECDLSGCNNSPRVLATGQSNAFSMAVDDVAVYWCIPSGTNGTIMRVAKQP